MATDSTPFPGSPIARGPMGGDQYTQVHNLVFRDARLSAKAMGVFAHLSTHTERWRVNERTIAANMRDGRDAIRAALRELESGSYLIRARERRVDGSLGESVWYLTDLPAQLRALGVTDDALIAGQVREHFHRWQHPSAAPTTENPSLAVTSENAATAAPASPPVVDNLPVQPCSPSAAPTTENPTLADPTLENPPPKKTKDQKTNQPTSLRSVGCAEDQSSPSVPSEGDAPAAYETAANTEEVRTDKLPVGQTGDTENGAVCLTEATDSSSPEFPSSERPTQPQRANEAANQTGDAAGVGQTFGQALIAAPEFQADWQRLDLRPGQRHQLAHQLDKALLRFDSTQVAGYLHMKTTKARTVKWLLDAFRVYGDAIGDQPKPDHSVTDGQLLRPTTTDQAAGATPATHQPVVAANPSGQPASDTTKAQARELIHTHLASKHAA